MNVLYITYDGAMEPLGKSQVIPYLSGLASRGYQISLLSYEKPSDLRNDDEIVSTRAVLREKQISWTYLRYHKRPTSLATQYDIIVGFIWGMISCLRRRIRIVHARSYVPALIAIALKRVLSLKVIFDMRGFWPEERIDGGIWKEGSILFRLAKHCEALFLKRADRVVVLTEPAKIALLSRPGLAGYGARIEVIPTCVDLELFRKVNAVRRPPEFDQKRLYVYQGSLGTWYSLDQLLTFFADLRSTDQNAHLLFLTRHPEKDIRRAIANTTVSQADVSYKSVPYRDVAGYLSLGEALISFRRPGLSAPAMLPTKIGEALACGLPVVINSGVGGLDNLLSLEKVAVVVPSFEAKDLKLAAAQIRALIDDPETPGRCRRIAERHFSLKEGVRRYERLYRALGCEEENCPAEVSKNAINTDSDHERQSTPWRL